jgi:Uma2 family endonuclease
MSTKTRATIEDLYKVEGKAELVNGEIVRMPPSGDEPSSAGFKMATHLKAYARRIGRGQASPDGTSFHVNLPHWESFGPDAAYHLGPRTGMRFLEGAPVFAVEVRSENDKGRPTEPSPILRHLSRPRGAGALRHGGGAARGARKVLLNCLSVPIHSTELRI